MVFSRLKNPRRKSNVFDSRFGSNIDDLAGFDDNEDNDEMESRFQTISKNMSKIARKQGHNSMSLSNKLKIAFFCCDHSYECFERFHVILSSFEHVD